METNNKLREVLIDVVERLEAYVGCDHHTFHPTATTCDGITSVGKCGKIGTCAAIFKARAALAKPRLNCEVGTVQEQSERFRDYCEAHKDNYAECLYCPLVGETGGHCELAWAQLPYESEAAK